MNYWMRKRWLLLITCTPAFGLPTVVSADAVGTTRAGDTESDVEIEFFSVGDSKSNIGDAQMGTSGIRVETQYEKNDKVFSFNYERWNYTWKNPEALAFSSGTASPWSTFNTFQFGFAYEQEFANQWELFYYIEAESSFEKETSASREYEAGIDFTYEPSKNWAFTLNTNLEYLDGDPEGVELGVDLEIEWNHKAKEGWSGEFEVSSEFPETTLRYHFNRAFSTAVFYNESGTNTIRLSDSSPIPGMQGGYLEDQYNALGIKLNFEVVPENYLSFSLQQNSGRQLSLTDKTGRVEEVLYDFGDSVEFSIQYSSNF